ncbi:tumor protein p53-inducible nuclear protein 1 isoform X6 [Apteryx rowi]|uniref:tumor protein p53-inducible nuclear protein 1 isoform X6 n=1 Tax=Apteryx rowi TaxID=308060 RepID=UPI000E1D49A0|nr:tumor protein p53-inducible nuclear protein 1 isoform X6 [Apteryx rowi]
MLCRPLPLTLSAPLLQTVFSRGNSTQVGLAEQKAPTLQKEHLSDRARIHVLPFGAFVPAARPTGAEGGTSGAAPPLRALARARRRLNQLRHRSHRGGARRRLCARRVLWIDAEGNWKTTDFKLSFRVLFPYQWFHMNNFLPVMTLHVLYLS